MSTAPQSNPFGPYWPEFVTFMVAEQEVRQAHLDPAEIAAAVETDLDGKPVLDLSLRGGATIRVWDTQRQVAAAITMAKKLVHGSALKEQVLIHQQPVSPTPNDRGNGYEPADPPYATRFTRKTA